MEDTVVFGPVNKVVESANILGALSASSVWALVTLALLYYIYWDSKQDKELRKESIESHDKMSSAIQALAQEVAILRVVVQGLKGSGDNHV